MESALKDSILTVCRLMEKHTAQYIIVGGTAVALNGYYRLSINVAGVITEKPDIDIWYNPTYDNYYKIIAVMEELGQDVAEFRNEQTPNPRSSFFKLDFDDFTLDFLPQIMADFKFREAYDRKQTVELQDTEIHFMNCADLLEDKEATGRKKDLDDIEHLKKIGHD